MKKDTKDLIIEELLTIISHHYNDGVFRDTELLVRCENNNPDDVTIYKLIIKGERDKGTPFYCASVNTCIIQEFYSENQLCYASSYAEEKGD